MMWLEVSAIFCGSFAVALSGALMPGPLLTFTVVESARRGFQAGPLVMTGHALLELLLVVAIILGLAPYLKAPRVMGTIALLGGIMLGGFGFDMIRTAARHSLQSSVAATGQGKGTHPVVMGAVVSLANPYWTLWWATIGLGYLVAAMKFGTIGIAGFFLGHITADYAWYCLVSLGISRGKNMMRDRSYQFIIRLCGWFLLGFGGWFLYSAGSYFSA